MLTPLKTPIEDVMAVAQRRHWDGAIAFSREMAQAIGADGRRPVVVVGEPSEAPFASVGLDVDSIGQMAARHLVDTGLRAFGACANAHQPPLYHRVTAFKRHLADLGHACDVFPNSAASDDRWFVDLPSWADAREGEDLQRLADWIFNLPKPVGIFASCDADADDVRLACHRLRLDVPGTVAIIGVGDDEMLCDYNHPGLSSVQTDGVAVGYRAAARLDRMLLGKPDDLSPELIPAVGVRRRASTHLELAEDPTAAHALRYLREAACRGINVEDVVQATGVSRRTLERASMAHFGLSPHAEIRRIQIERAEDLLAGTNLPIAEIAEQAGFSASKYFSEAFRRDQGITPTAYRRKSALATTGTTNGFAPPLRPPNAPSNAPPKPSTHDAEDHRPDRSQEAAE